MAAHHDALAPDIRARTIFPRYLDPGHHGREDGLTMRAFLRFPERRADARRSTPIKIIEALFVLCEQIVERRRTCRALGAGHVCAQLRWARGHQRSNSLSALAAKSTVPENERR